jgi:hypothetical protein
VAGLKLKVLPVKGVQETAFKNPADHGCRTGFGKNKFPGAKKTDD